MKAFENLHGLGCPWHQYSEQFGHGTVNWCEEHLCSWITNPANTWSNLGYIIVGIFAIWAAKKAKSPYELKILGLNILIMGIGSFIWHATNIFPGQVLDFFGMFLYTYLILSWNIWRTGFFNAKKRKIFFFFLTIFSTFLCIYFYFAKLNLQFIVAVTAIGIVATEYWARNKGSIPKNKSYFLYSMAFLGTGQILSQLDMKRIWCDPANHFLLQGHAWWHILGAIGVYFSYLHYSQIKLTK